MIATTPRMQDTMSKLKKHLLLLASLYCKTIAHGFRHVTWNSHEKSSATPYYKRIYAARTQSNQVLHAAFRHGHVKKRKHTLCKDFSPLFAEPIGTFTCHQDRSRQLWSSSRACGAINPTYIPSRLQNADRTLDSGHLQPIVR